LFGVDSATGSGVRRLARELLAEFPQADAQLVVLRPGPGSDKKLFHLRQLEPLIRHRW